jgi:hypothetical protein
VDTNQIGDTSLAAVLTALLKVGKVVLFPWGNAQRYDLVLDDEGRFYRVQIKTGKLIRNGKAVMFRTANYVKGRYKHYQGEIELFGVYCPENEKVYLVPVEDTRKYVCVLRLAPTRNGQKLNVHLADDYVLAPR